LKLSKEVKTGILALGAILLFIFGYSFLKGTNLFAKNRMFYVKYENVEGLAKSAPVTINGLQVGKVQDINFGNKEGGLVVTFTVDSDFVFSRNSIVQIYSSGFIGGNNLGIVPEYDPNNIAQRGDTLKGEISKGILDAVSESLGPLEKKVENTLAGLDTLFAGISEILDDKTRSDLKSTISNLNQTMGSFKNASRNIDKLLASNEGKLNNTFSNLEVTTENFARFSDSLAQIETGALVAQIEDVLSGFNTIVANINDGKGSVGKLLNDEALYDNLEGASRQLEQLLQDVKLNPKRYVNISVFGKKQKEFVTPENPDQ